MKKVLTIFFSLALLYVTNITRAEEEAFSSSLDSLPLGNLSEQADWTTTKHDTNTNGTISISASETIPNEKFIEIINDDSMLTSQSRTPLNAGTLQFKARHNKSGLFYLYAQTSDNGGQLLYSIQFTESNGLLLEESDKQIVLLPDYNSDQWYFFEIDFDNTKGDHGAFTIKIDGENFGEYEYVKSESELFDFAQITIGSESGGETSISAFADSFPSLPETATTTASTSEALLLLSITYSSTTISSDLDNGLTVTATLDGLFTVTIASSTMETATSAEASSSTDTNSTIGSIIMDIVENVIDIFTPEEIPPVEPPSTESIPSEIIEPELIPTEPVATTSEDVAPLSPVENPEPEPTPENEVQSSITTEEVLNNETITTEF
jgi:hypothetical protein